ncbi:MAG: hypothetical protein E7290_07675 [Lachnospiraceae bacterium]|nr:hypothetical protein [Lachnospiraceae bacterium]
MKKVKGILLGIGLGIILCGCGVAVSNEPVEKEMEMTIVKDELVSTSHKIVEEKVEIETVEASSAEELAEDRESIQTVKTNENESGIEENKQVCEEMEENPVYKDGVVTQEDFVIQIGDVLVHTGDTMNTMLEELGEPDDFVQARSCFYDGDDKVYTYGGISIYTYPSKADDIVYLIEVSGNEKLLSGIGVGSTRADMIVAYGEEYVEFGTMLAYDLSENASISFQVENDIITFIEIYNE